MAFSSCSVPAQVMATSLRQLSVQYVMRTVPFSKACYSKSKFGLGLLFKALVRPSAIKCPELTEKTFARARVSISMRRRM